MNIIFQIFDLVVYGPLLGFLGFIYNVLPYKDFGIAVIILTIVIRLILLPSSLHSLRSQKALGALQPEMKKIQDKHKDNKEKQAKAMFDLYKKKKVSPFGGILSIFIQIPILVGLYKVFLNGFQDGFNYLFLGVVDLSSPNFYMALVAGISQFFSSKYMMSMSTVSLDGKGKEFQQIFQKQIIYFLPIFTFFILLKLPSVLALYFLISNIFTVFQQYIIIKEGKKNETSSN